MAIITAIVSAAARGDISGGASATSMSHASVRSTRLGKLPMRESLRRDGCVALHPNDDDNDVAIVEPVLVKFIPRNLHCGCCGAPQRPWSWHVVDDGAELICHACHSELAAVELGTKVHHE
jgi:hypothetical protein